MFTHFFLTFLLLGNFHEFNFLCFNVGEALLDLMRRSHEDSPNVNERILCRHPTQASKRVFVVPGRVEPLLKLYWNYGKVI